MEQFANGSANFVDHVTLEKSPLFISPHRGCAASNESNDVEISVADVRALSLDQGRRILTRHAGIFLFVPLLAQLRFDRFVTAADYPGSKMIPATNASSRRRNRPGKPLSADARKSWAERADILRNGTEKQGFCYSNANLMRAQQSGEVLRFIEFWRKIMGKNPQWLYFDSKLTTYDELSQITKMKDVSFVTIRRRGSSIMRRLENIPASTWTPVVIDILKRRHQQIRCVDELIRIPGYEGRR